MPKNASVLTQPVEWFLPMWPARSGPILRSMSSYAVLWQNGDGDPMSGRLEFDPRGLSLHGGNRESQGRVEIPFDEIVGVERHPCMRIGPCRAIRLTTRAAGSLLLATVAGVGVLSEILSLVQDSLAALP